jgi:hypothetical protein
MQASNFMDIEDLLNIGCKTVASMIKDKSSNEIRKIFNITNDFNLPKKEWVESRPLALLDELIDRILKELPRFDYLKFLVMISNSCRLYFAGRIEKELAIEIGHFGATKEGAADDLSHVLEGWNVERPDFDIHHCKVDALSSFPDWS